MNTRKIRDCAAGRSAGIRGCLDVWYRCFLKRLYLFIEKRIEQPVGGEQDGILRKPQPKRFTVKKHIIYVLVFSISGFLVITLPIILTMFIMSKNYKNLEGANAFFQNISMARQYEKDYFITSKGLDNVLLAVSEAKKVLIENYTSFAGEVKNGIEIGNLEEYERQLFILKDMESEEGSSVRKSSSVDFENYSEYLTKKEKISRKLNYYGIKINSFADTLVKNINESMEKSLLFFYVINVYVLVFLFILAFALIHLLSVRILRAIKELNAYTSSIAVGNFNISLPYRPFSDEFSDLKTSITQMMKELDRQQSVLAQSQKLRAVGTLTAGIAHELNNPINNIMLTAHMLLEDYFDICDEERVDMIRDLIDEAGRARLIVRNLLDFARESESIMEPICIGQVVKETMKIASSQIKLSGVFVDLNIPPNLPRIHGDRHQLEQVFLNLILNALYVTLKGGRISISVEYGTDEPNFVAVKVTDYGKGIQDHILQHIFDPFFTTKAKGKGTGLGLSVSQGIIAKHGGHISVNTKMNKGTTFTVKLPITTIPANIGSSADNYSVQIKK
ncbi:MAG: HAMP domain-containing histidine kinase [Candidatus Magnetoovum sp. WYHC-5]|nr:HAMP domain-containing histidine kinase [Candidatus Magnetoovum sp. WYHC-5]